MDSLENLPEPIDRAYLLVIHIPYYFDERGAVWLDRLWHRDFVRHLTYLRQMTVAAPAYPLLGVHGKDLVRVEVPSVAALEFVPLRDDALSSMHNFFSNVAQLWNAVGRSEIVHSHIIGYPTSWIANCFALLRRKRLLIMVEGIPWQLTDTRSNGWKARGRVRALDTIGRWFVNRASISFFTQPSYRDMFLTRRDRPGFVTPASWIDEADVLGDGAAAEAWRNKIKPANRARLLFAGRLILDKGIKVLLDALAILRERSFEIDVDIIGEGHLRAKCVAAAAANGEPRIRVLDPVAYGAAFFALLNNYHAIVVPSLGDEQPRIIFDAYAQALPVIASDTDGLRPHVFPGRTGWLIARGDARRLADANGRSSRVLAGARTYGSFRTRICPHHHAPAHARRTPAPAPAGRSSPTIRIADSPSAANNKSTQSSRMRGMQRRLFK